MSNNKHITIKQIFIERPEGLLLIVTAEQDGETINAAVVDWIPPDDWFSIHFHPRHASTVE